MIALAGNRGYTVHRRQKCGYPEPVTQMPKGVPVACVGVDNGDNAAWLAIRILKLSKK